MPAGTLVRDRERGHVLRDLKARGETTAILSNGTPEMLGAAVTAGKIELDAVLSVDAIRIYKPRPEVYALVTSRFQCMPADIVFVSSNRWDVMGAANFGFRTAWINRAHMPEEYGPTPDAVLADHRIVALRQFANEGIGGGRPRHFLDFGKGCAEAAIGDIGAHAVVEQADLLSDQRDGAAQ